MVLNHSESLSRENMGRNLGTYVGGGDKLEVVESDFPCVIGENKLEVGPTHLSPRI